MVLNLFEKIDIERCNNERINYGIYCNMNLALSYVGFLRFISITSRDIERIYFTISSAAGIILIGEITAKRFVRKYEHECMNRCGTMPHL